MTVCGTQMTLKEQINADLNVRERPLGMNTLVP
jgi:hypothetical protein